ncbi:MAG: SIMPL domain-containing protein [Anaerolineae bacterium]|nr:SIMPL domain-containing protein [Chloroflexota bacterium]
MYVLPLFTGRVAAQSASRTPTVEATAEPKGQEEEVAAGMAAEAGSRAVSESGRTITVVGEGKVSATPDMATITMGVETVGKSVQEATKQSGEVMTDLLAVFEEQGVDSKDVRTSGYSVWADFGSREEMAGENGAPIYRVTNVVSVTVRDLDVLSAVLDGAIEAGANAIHGITFSIEDKAGLAADARALAADDAEARAQELAGLFGVEVGGVVSVSEVIGNSVFPMMRDAAMAETGGGGAGPISAGNLDYSVQLQVVYSIQ